MRLVTPVTNCNVDFYKYKEALCSFTTYDIRALWASFLFFKGFDKSVRISVAGSGIRKNLSFDQNSYYIKKLFTL